MFTIHVDRFAAQYFSLSDVRELYSNDISFLGQFTSDDAAVGNAPAYRAADVLRMLGYLETCGNVIYPDGVYKKMNMIQEEWDTNNQGLPLVKPLGSLTGLRTVLTPALEEILAQNYQSGATDVRVFEVGHIYLPIEGETLPKEHFAVSMGAYGPDVTLESFTRDVVAVLESLGITKHMFAPTDMAIAYEAEECRLVISGAGVYLNSNFGQISKKATGNYGIGVPAYMAQMELDALVLAGQTQRRATPAPCAQS